MPVLRAFALVLLLLGTLAVGLLLQASARFGAVVPTWLPVLFCRLMLGTLGVRLTIRGASHPRAARLLVANHVSWLDILALGAVEPLCFSAKREVGSWPVIGPLAHVLDTIFVDRTRRMSIPRVNRAMAARLSTGRSVLLFPEGTTRDGVALGPFKTSHLACLRVLGETPSGSPGPGVQPVLVAYSDPRAAWIGDATLLPHLWSVLSGPALRCTLVFGDPAAVAAGFDRKALGRSLRAAIDDLRPLALAAGAPRLDGANTLKHRALLAEPGRGTPEDAKAFTGSLGSDRGLGARRRRFGFPGFGAQGGA